MSPPGLQVGAGLGSLVGAVGGVAAAGGAATLGRGEWTSQKTALSNQKREVGKKKNCLYLLTF